MYHSSDCPLSKEDSHKTDNGSYGDQDANGNISPSRATQTACSCDAETQLKLSQQNSQNDLNNLNSLDSSKNVTSDVAIDTSAGSSQTSGAKTDTSTDQQEDVDGSQSTFVVGSVEEDHLLDQSGGASSTTTSDGKSRDVTTDVTTAGSLDSSHLSRDQSQDKMEMDQPIDFTTKPADSTSQSQPSDKADADSGDAASVTCSTAAAPSRGEQAQTELSKQQDTDSAVDKSSALGIGTPIPQSENKGKEPATPPNTPGTCRFLFARFLKINR